MLGIMEVDAMQYAGISKEMTQTGQYLQVHEFGRDYLDKPPLLFWLSSLSMLFLGFQDWSYKLISVSILLYSGYAVFRWALLYYGQEVGKNAMLIWLTCQAFFLMTNDVRTDGLLSGFVVISLWLFSAYFENKNFKNFLLASASMGMAMLAKGPIGMVAVLMPLGLHLMIKGQWKDFFNLRWVWMIIIVGIMLAPMLWGLYTQFDLHPEKEVYGLKGPSGIWFYFWTQSFGRVTGENYWDNGSPWHFFLGSIWWDFFPWVLLLFPAIYHRIRTWKKQKEYISFFGFVAIFAMLSMSNYKLPHYIFVTLPMASIMVASYVPILQSKYLKLFRSFIIYLGGIGLLGFWLWPILCFPPLNFSFCIIWIVALGAFYLAIKNRDSKTWVTQTMLSIFIIPLFMSFVMYPDLLPFQVSSALAKEMVETVKPDQDLAILDMDMHAVDFYSEKKVRRIHGDDHIFDQSDTLWIITLPDHLRNISNIRVLKQRVYAGFHITRLSGARIMASSRPSQCTDSLVLAYITH